MNALMDPVPGHCPSVQTLNHKSAVTPAIRAGSLLPEVMSGVGKHPPPNGGKARQVEDKSRLSLITDVKAAQHCAGGLGPPTHHPPMVRRHSEGDGSGVTEGSFEDWVGVACP